MTSPTPPPWKPSSTGCWTTPPRNYPRWPTTSTRPGPTYWPSPPSPKPCGPRSGPTTPKSASTVRSAAAPIRWASSPPATPLPAWSEPSWPSKPTNGPKDAATSASTSWPAAASPPSTTPQTRSPPNQNTHSNSPHNQPTKDQPLHHYKGLDRRGSGRAEAVGQQRHSARRDSGCDWACGGGSVQGGGLDRAQLVADEPVGVSRQVGRVLPAIAPDAQRVRERFADHRTGERLEHDRTVVPGAGQGPERRTEVHAPGAQVPAVALADVEVVQLLTGVQDRGVHPRLLDVHVVRVQVQVDVVAADLGQETQARAGGVD